MPGRQVPPVRLVLVVTCLALPMLGAGCLDQLDEATSGPVCPRTEVSMPGRSANVVHSSSVPDEVKDATGERPRVQLAALKGQTVLAMAFFSMAGGDITVDYDGPTDHLQEVAGTQRAYAAQGISRGGNHTLELQGSPVATLVWYSLTIQVSGCPDPDA